MANLIPSQIATLITLDTLLGVKTSDQAAAFELTPLAFGNFMKGLVKAGMVAKVAVDVDGGTINTYVLTEEGCSFLPTLPAPLPGFSFEAPVEQLEAEEPVVVLEATPSAGFSIPADPEAEVVPSPKKSPAFAATIYVSILRNEAGFLVSPKRKNPEVVGLTSKQFTSEELAPSMTKGLQVATGKLALGAEISGFVPPAILSLV